MNRKTIREAKLLKNKTVWKMSANKK